MNSEDIAHMVSDLKKQIDSTVPKIPMQEFMEANLRLHVIDSWRIALMCRINKEFKYQLRSNKPEETVVRLQQLKFELDLLSLSN